MIYTYLNNRDIRSEHLSKKNVNSTCQIFNSYTMKMKILTITILVSCSLPANLAGQNKDKAMFRESQPGFYRQTH